VRASSSGWSGWWTTGWLPPASCLLPPAALRCRLWPHPCRWHGRLAGAMSVVVQVGQAGNQIGEELWATVSAEAERQGWGVQSGLFREEASSSRWSAGGTGVGAGGGVGEDDAGGSLPRLTARCVAVDSEPQGLGGLAGRRWMAPDDIVVDAAHTGAWLLYAASAPSASSPTKQPSQTPCSPVP
jgi:hypothetical protein